MQTDEPAIDQRQVLAREWRDIRLRRGLRAVDQPAPPQNLVGLALSGGGIRSATFCLGVLQAFGELGLLRIFDYLSTVSGGGFVGGWWSAWLARDENLALFPPREGIEPQNRIENRHNGTTFVEGGWFAGHDPVHHLRLFANYLTPRKGALSPDSWRSIAVISRNLMLTWAVLIPLLIGLILIGQAYFVGVGGESLENFYGAPTSGEIWNRFYQCIGLIEAIGAVVVLLSVVWLLIHRGDSSFAYYAGIASVVLATGIVAGVSSTTDEGSWLTSIRGTAYWSLPGLGLVLYSFRSPGGGIKIESRRDLWRNQIVRVHSTVLVVGLVATATLAVTGFGHSLAMWIWQSASTSIQAAGMTSVLVTIGTAVVTAYKVAPTGGADRDRTEASLPVRSAIAVAPPLVLVVLCLLLAWASGGLVHRDLPADIRPYPVFIAVAMCTGFAVLDLWLFEGWPDAGTVVLTILLGALLAQNRGAFDWLAADRPWVTLAPMTLAAVAIGVEAWRGQSGRRSIWLIGAGIVLVTAHLTAPTDDLHIILSFIALCVVWVVGLGWMTDPNMVSMHGFYKARLVRAYLGASNTRRYKEERQITEAATGDDVLLRDLTNCEKGGPYHLVNTTLNLVGGRDLTTAQRCAASFTLTRHHCGSWRTRYRRTEDYMGGELSLGTAIAISGAAVSPNMGTSTPSSALTLLMTFLNLRLGFWAPTPNRNDWRSPQARMWPFYLLKESLSQTNDLTTYCYLTDGGHFDNTGIYSLVERGCRYIVGIDCGADPTLCFEDLGNTIRRARIDFGAEIDLDLGAFTTATPRHFIVGTIVYHEGHVRSLGWEDTTVKARTGVIVVIKPHITGARPADVQQYSHENPFFPQQTTADQWFDEAQFESYRRLGEVSTMAAFGRFAAIGDVEALFASMCHVADAATESARTHDPGHAGDGADTRVH